MDKTTRSSASSGQEAGRRSRKPRIGDTRPAPNNNHNNNRHDNNSRGNNHNDRRASNDNNRDDNSDNNRTALDTDSQSRYRRRRRGRSRRDSNEPIEAVTSDDPVELDEKAMTKRRGRTRRGKPVGRYSMYVHVGSQATHIAILEGRRLLEYYASRSADDINEIYGNVYLGRVTNVLPGMETAFVDIGTPKNAVIYRGDIRHAEIELGTLTRKDRPRIEDMVTAGQQVICQVTKNPIGEKGARLTQEVALAGRFVVLIPNAKGVGISKRLPDRERRRLKNIVDRVRPDGFGVILRTAAEGVTAEEINRDVSRLVSQWDDIDKLAKRSDAPAMIYREPETTLRLLREELTSDFRRVVIDDRQLYEETSDYVNSIISPLADRLEYYDRAKEDLPLFERYFVVEQLRKALSPKVWLPGGGSLIIEHTEALTVVDVNTARNVGTTNLEETILKNNLEAAEELARQLRLRDIGGIIVVDFVDMVSLSDRDKVVSTFRNALSRDKTRTQVFDMSSLCLVQMTRKRIGEGLLESLSEVCDQCEGQGKYLLDDLVDEPLEHWNDDDDDDGDDAGDDDDAADTTSVGSDAGTDDAKDGANKDDDGIESLLAAL